LVEKKGLEYGLRALSLIRSELPMFEWHIVGSGPLRVHLEGLCNHLGLSDVVVFHGEKPREEVQRILERSHVFLAPSVTSSSGEQEGIPVAIMEAMASGLPVVSTDHSGIPELVTSDETGYLVPEKDASALAQMILRLAREPESWAALGRRGRERIERDYDVHRLNDQLVDILSSAAPSAFDGVPSD
jgi:colanic acid/amylovoran biosynthesis glycosyltransferase